MHTGSRRDPVKSYRKPPVTNYFLGIFPAANERLALENINQSQRRNLRRVSVSIFKTSKYFQRSKEKANNFIGQWKAFERPWKPSAHTQKVRIPSRDTVPLSCWLLGTIIFLRSVFYFLTSGKGMKIMPILRNHALLIKRHIPNISNCGWDLA
jgi:hypothetical protein